MNWNGQRQWLDHSINLRHDPTNRGKLQADLNAYRRKRVIEALKSRPVFLPLSFEMTAAAQTSPYRDITPLLNYDVIVTGVKSDTQTRDIIVRRGVDESSLVSVGDESSLYLRCDEFAGQGATNGGGQLGTFYLPTPLLLNAGQRLTVEMFKTDVTADAEEANIVLVGVRVFPKSYGIDMLGDQGDAVDHFIRVREIPTIHYLKQVFDFDLAKGAGGEARNLFTPRRDEPLLIRGCRTTLRHSLIELGIQGEPSWTTEPTPCWAIAAEDELIHENYNWFSKPIYLPANGVIEVRRVVNSIDGTLIDAETGNTITWICETV